MLSFDHNTFVRLKNMSSTLADNYLSDCGLKEQKENTNLGPVIETPVETIKHEISELKEDVNGLEIKVDDFTEDEVEFTRADLIEKLKTAGIKFMPNSKDETLLQKCITNNLI